MGTEQSAKRSLAWGMKWFALAVGSSYVVRLARGAIIPKLLAPLEYGLASSLLLPLNYLRYCDLGVLDQLAKRLPYLRSREGEEAFHRHVNLGTGWTLGTSLLAAFGLFVFSSWMSGPHAEFYRTGLRLVSFSLVAQRVRLLLTVILNAREEFRFAETGAILAEVGLLAFGVPLVMLWGAIGMIWAFLFSEAVASIYLASKAGMPGLAYAFQPLSAMVREGFLLFSIAAAALVMTTLDQVFLLLFFPMGEYGLYMIGLALSNIVLWSSTIFNVAQPRVMSMAGLGREDEAKKVVSSTLSLYFLILATALGAAPPAVALAVRYYLTRYQAGLGLYIVMPLMALVQGPAWLLRPYFLARNDERRYIKFQVMGSLAILLLMFPIVVFSLGLIAIAMAMICGFGVTSILAIVRFEGSVANVIRGFKRYALFVASVLGVSGIYTIYLVRTSGTGRPTDVMGLLAAAIFYELGMLAVIYWSRADWLGALKVIRARPSLDAEEAGVVLSEIELAEAE